MTEPSLNLLDLPVDILSLILVRLLESSEPIQLCPCSSRPPDIDPLPVLLAHPSLHAVAAPLLFSVNEFVLDATGPHARHVRRRLEGDGEAAAAANDAGVGGVAGWGSMDRAPACLLTTRDARRRMTNLQVRFERLRAWVHDGLVPVLTDMVFAGSLEHLTIWVRTPEGEKRAGTGTGPLLRRRRAVDDPEEDELAMFARPPLEGLIRVLADPYLRTARLWVDGRRHLPGWCRFHAAGRGVECGRLYRAGREEEGEDRREGEAEVAGLEDEADDVVEVDWREVLRVVDPERRDVAVALEGTKRWY